MNPIPVFPRCKESELPPRPRAVRLRSDGLYWRVEVQGPGWFTRLRWRPVPMLTGLRYVVYDTVDEARARRIYAATKQREQAKVSGWRTVETTPPVLNR